MLAAIERPDGKITTRLESAYLDTEEEFRDAFESDFKDDQKTLVAMHGLALRLALIDATGVESHKNDNPAERERSIKEYRELRAKLDDPNTSFEQKAAIYGLFDAMSGASLVLVEQQYKDAERGVESEVTKEDYDKAVSEMQEEISKQNEALSETFLDFNAALKRLREEIEEYHSRDPEVLRERLDEVKELRGEINDLANNLGSLLIHFEELVGEAEGFATEDEQSERLSWHEMEESDLSNIYQVVDQEEENLKKIEDYVTKLEYATSQIGSGE